MIWKLCVCIAAIAALAMPSTAMAGRTLDVDPHQVKFGKQPWNSFTKRTFKIKNVSNKPVVGCGRARLRARRLQPGPARVDLPADESHDARSARELHPCGRLLRGPGRARSGGTARSTCRSWHAS